MESKYAIEMINITKEFPGIIANNNINFKVKKGEIHALIGENGAGKSTLMSVLFGLYNPEEGYIKVNGKIVDIKNPNMANNLGIGMVHQHFKLVDIYSKIDNIILGAETTKYGFFISKKQAIKKVNNIAKKYNLPININLKIEKASVGEQQRVEILKMLFRNARILIFDEPTSVLSPKEIIGLLKTMEDFKKTGKTIIFISHKLKEIKVVADSATIIRKGKVVGNVDVKKTSIKKIASMMVGRDLVEIKNQSKLKLKKNILEISNLNVKHRSQKGILGLKNFSLNIKAGEIVSIAGVEGNGQTELAQAISGLIKSKSGDILLNNVDILKLSINKRYDLGISHIPEDRHKHAMILDFNIRDNMILQKISKRPFSKFGIKYLSEAQRFTNLIINEYDVRGARSGKSIARQLSGGNQQKAIVGREMLKSYSLLLAVQPTRGLDLGAIEFIHKSILKAKEEGKAILLISYELDEVIALSDRVIVLNQGEIMGELSSKRVTREKIGILMAGNKNEK